MQSFIRGQKAKLADLLSDDDVLVGIDLHGPQAPVVLCAGLDAGSRLVGDDWLISAARPSSPDGSVTYLGPSGGDEHAFRVTLSRLAAVERLAFCVGLDSQGGMRGVTQGHVRLSGAGGEVMRYPVTAADFGDEQAVVLAEIYRKDVWRVAAVGAGFVGGTGALLDKYGAAHLAAGLVQSAPAPQPPPAPQPHAPQPPPAPQPHAPQPPPAPQPHAPQPPAPQPPSAPQPGWNQPPAPQPPSQPGWNQPPAPQPAAPQPPPAHAPPQPPAPQPAAPAASGGVNLGKVTLGKQGEARTVSLRKEDGNYNPLHFNLNWSANTGQPKKRRGFLSMGGSQQAPDLDLGCMFEMVDGQASVIQPLGGYFGDAHNAPWILLDKDDRTGAATDGENLYVYRPEMIRRLVVFALIYEGAADFQSVGGVLSIRDGNGAETIVELNNPDANRTFCAIAMVTNTGSGIEIRKEERYFTRHRECDAYFQFGFEWEAGRK